MMGSPSIKQFTKIEQRNISSRNMMARKLFFCTLLSMLIVPMTGCSLFVMTGKMIFGDPVLKCDFHQATNINLIDDKKTVLVICDTPDSIKIRYPSLHFDIVDGISHKLKRQEIKMISPGDVASWLDDNGGYWEDISEIADAFDTDYIIHLDISHFDYREQNSQTLLRGRLTADIKVYEVKNDDKTKKSKASEDEEEMSKQVFQIYSSDYVSEYPSFNPISVDRKSEKIFKKEYLSHVCNQISQIFYDHRSFDKLF